MIKNKIKQFILESFKQDLDLGSYIQEKYISLVNFFNDDISDNLINSFINNPDFDFILETLNSHDKLKLQNKLINKFELNIKHIYNYNKDNSKNKDSFWIILNKDVDINDFKKNIDLINLLDYFDYYISQIDIFNKILFIEPKFSNIVDLTGYHNICYHFTNMKNIDSILRNGLRIKNNSYRTYPERIYLYKINNLFSNNQLNPDILLFISKYLKIKNVAIFKVNLNNINIPIYNDTAMIDNNSLFTYNNIPSKYLKLIKVIKNIIV